MKVKRFPPIMQEVIIRCPVYGLRHEFEDVTRICPARLTSKHPAAPKGKPVLRIDGEPLGPVVASRDYRIVKASERERALLAAGGYELLDVNA